MRYIGIYELTLVIRNNIYLIPSDIDIIVGIPRSGMLVANYIALLLNKPITDLEGLLENRIMQSGRTKDISQNITRLDECKKILVLDDSVASGKSIMECRERIETIGLDKKFSILYGTIFVAPESKEYVDIFFECIEGPRLFEWNIFHQQYYLKNACIDIDGVLCKDPTIKENDDGKNYRIFLKNAKPKIIPSCRVGYIVTSRLEKYRRDTENWLLDNGVRYDNLIMLDSTAEERSKLNLHAKFKADFYSKVDSDLFIESDENQAIEIHSLTGKPVYCVTSGNFFDGGISFKIKRESKLHVYSFLMRNKYIKKMYLYLKLRTVKR